MTETSMLERRSVRMLLLDPENRVLLVKCANLGLVDVPDPFWGTAGGGIEAGESFEDAARRETFEETGISDLTLGPVVWTQDLALQFPNEPLTLFRNNYMVAHCRETAISSAGWTQQERDTIVEMRWWTMADIRATRETILPERFAELLAPVLRGVYPAVPIVLPGK